MRHINFFFGFLLILFSVSASIFTVEPKVGMFVFSEANNRPFVSFSFETARIEIPRFYLAVDIYSSSQKYYMLGFEGGVELLFSKRPEKFIKASILAGTEGDRSFISPKLAAGILSHLAEASNLVIGIEIWSGKLGFTLNLFAGVRFSFY